MERKARDSDSEFKDDGDFDSDELSVSLICKFWYWVSMEQEEDDSFFSSFPPYGKNQCHSTANAMHSLKLFHSTVLVVMMQILKEKKTLENEDSFFSSHSPPSS
ncbi:hypothetical protein DVH24_013946 [Malus domestica]|uniref:Uncharacterized protein n=1 Tax=Malus domestica TaxID=3750 RepID=A0A498JCX5_MALDO|nr:hypothetical protein DVH24_013946 [Malus domestica]